jgi:outer membrane lipoprotein-sorting protein
MSMKFLRTVSTRRLLALIGGLVVAAAAGTTIAVAASGSGPKPGHKSLARAIHDAAAAPQIGGVTADITFTNRLIDSTNLQGKDPILNGASGRLWLSADGRLRLELQSDRGSDAQVLVSKSSFWVYDPSSNTAYEGTLPAENGAAKKAAGTHQIPSIAQIQSRLASLAKHLNLTGAIPSDVAGQPAYTVRVSPKHDGGLLGAAELAWDSVKGVPLRFAVYAQHQSAPVLELKATGITYGQVPSSAFSISPPSGAKVVKVATPGANAGTASSRRGQGARKHADVSGVAAVARHVPFKLVAPSTLVGLPRRSVTLLDWSGHPAALVTFGQGLGGVAVIEQAADKSHPAARPSGGEHQGLNLPTVSIRGATGQELDTALGTMVRFTRSGVSYTVVGSVPPAAADAAARGL